MLTKENVVNALKDVQDPELHKSVVELNMVRNVQIDGTHVSLEVVLIKSNRRNRSSITIRYNDR